MGRGLFLSLILSIAPIAAAAAADAPAEALPDRSLRVVIGAALSAIEDYSGAIWPASPDAPRQILLVDGEQEFLFCPEPSVAAELEAHGFAGLGADRLSGCDVAVRPRSFAPDLLATFPILGGVSTVVVGTPSAVGWSLQDWAATLIHEHVHQMQNASPGYYAGSAALGLAQGDESGRWMLDYEFPYGAAAPAFRMLADAAVAALGADETAFPAALEAYLAEREAFLEGLSAADARYVEFQLWQEGVARWSEGAIAEAAWLRWPLDAGWLAAWRNRNAVELAGADLAQDGRAAFYPLGAAEAALLERRGGGWRSRYLSEPFALGPYFEAQNAPGEVLPEGEHER